MKKYIFLFLSLSLDGLDSLVHFTFPMEIDALEYSQVKATLASVRLHIFLCVFKIPNKLSGAIAED